MSFDIASILTNGQTGLLVPALGALGLTAAAIWFLQGRAWALLYVVLIPFLNWSFGIIPEFAVVAPGSSNTFPQGVSLHPMTMVTGMVFVMVIVAAIFFLIVDQIIAVAVQLILGIRA